MKTGASANQVTSAMILNIANIRIKNNMTVMVSDLPSRHKLHGLGGHKMHIFTANIPTFHVRYRR
jgi:hypothetical protein